MVILGLGSNLGDRLQHLRDALQMIKKIPGLNVQQVSPVYISDALLPENAPSEWDRDYLNLALRCETTLDPYKLLELTKNIEKIAGRQHKKNWGPRPIDIDILAWDDLIQYDEKLHIPHEHLLTRPFALWPLADIAPRWIHPIVKKTAAELVLPWGSRFSGEAPLHTRQIQQRADSPQLVGILNITPDSFSDGGKFINPNDAIAQVKNLVADGADIIDIGAEATGPRAKPINAEAEWLRLEPILQMLLPELKRLPITPKISIDTRHSIIAIKALEIGVDWINDVTGLTDPAMRDIIANNTCDVVIMHHLSIPADKTIFIPRDQDPVANILHWGEKQIALLEKNNIHRERIIFDIGIGFGKTAEQDLELLNRITEFKKLNVRLLAGHSRKYFLQQFTQKPPIERDIETLSCSLHLANQEINYLRVHHIENHARAFKTIKNF